MVDRYFKDCKAYKTLLLCILFFGAANESLFAAPTTYEKLWSSFTLTGNYDRVVYYAEPQLRLVYADNPFQQTLANMGAGYQIDNHWQTWFGQTFSQNSQDAVPGSLDEYRLWEQVVWSGIFKRVQLISRTRLEQRKSLFFANWSHRLRERLLINQKLTTNMSLVIYDEVFYSFNHVDWVVTRQFDQNRAYVGLEQQLSESMFLSAGLMNQYLSFVNPQSDPVLVVNFRVNLAT